MTYEEVGCYEDNQVSPRPLPELLADLRSIVDWHALDKVIDKCAQLASDKGYTYFGLQSLGQCMSGKDAEKTFNKDGGSSGCIKGLGNNSENSVYRIIVQGKPLYNGNERFPSTIPDSVLSFPEVVCKIAGNHESKETACRSNFSSN